MPGIVDAAPFLALLKPAKLVRLFGAVTLAAAIALPLTRSDLSTLAITTIAGCVAAAGANALNMFLDRDRDALDSRTAGRPLPSGNVRPWQALVIALALIALGGAIVVSEVGALPGAITVAAIFLYASAYPWLKQHTPYYTLVGGAIWAAPIPVLWLALGRPIGLAPAGAFALAALWTTLHVWSSALTPGVDTAAAAPRFLPNQRGPQVTRMYVVALTCGLALITIILGLRAMLPFDAMLILAALASVCGAELYARPTPHKPRPHILDRAVSIAAIVFITAFIITTAARNLG